MHQGARLRVATKYVQAAREYFAAKGVYVDLIKLYGSMEMRAAGRAWPTAIVDLVSSGGTLRANNLVAVEEIGGDLLAAGRQPGGAETRRRACSRCWTSTGQRGVWHDRRLNRAPRAPVRRSAALLRPEG